MTTQSFIGKDGFTWWVGQVEKNDGDPAGLGRVKVRIAGWYTGENYKENIPTKMLPWAHVMQPTTEVGVKNIGKSNNRLGVGAIVMGFFLDGEEAQQPVVLGILRSFLNTGTDDKDKLKAGEWIADIKGSGGGFTDISTADMSHNIPLGQEATRGSARKGDRQDSNAAAANGAMNTNPGRDDSGAAAPNVGPGGNGSTELPASAANPSGVPSTCPRPVSNGKKGDFSEYINTLKYMLCDLGITIGSVTQSKKGNYLSVFTGKLVDIQSIIVKIKRFITYAFNGLFAELKAGIANLIGDAVETILAQFKSLPFIFQLLIDTAIQIVNKFMCEFELGNNFKELIGNAANFVQEFADDMINQFVGKITESISGALATVENITDSITGGLQAAVQIAGKIAQALSVVKKSQETAGKVVEAAKSAEFWSTQSGKDLISNIVNFIVQIILDLLFPDPCRREKSTDRVKNWLPLYGTSECDVDNLSQYDEFGNNPYLRENSPWNPALIKSENTFVENFANGSYIQTANKIGSRFVRKVDHAGSAKVTDEKGNTHEHKVSAETKIVEKDKVLHVKGNYVIEVDGDLIYKVHGDTKKSTDGVEQKFTSAGPEVDNEGNTTDKDARARESTATEGSDFSREYKGSYHIGANKISLHAAEGIDLKAQKGRIYMQGASIVGSAAGIGWTSSVETNYCSVGQYNVIGLSPEGVLSPTAGQFNMIFGKRMTTFASPTMSMDITTHLAPSSVVKHTQGTGAFYGVTQGSGGMVSFLGGPATAFAVNTPGKVSLASAGLMSIACAGKTFITCAGPITITATGPLTCLGVPIMLN